MVSRVRTKPDANRTIVWVISHAHPEVVYEVEEKELHNLIANFRRWQERCRNPERFVEWDK